MSVKGEPGEKKDKGTDRTKTVKGFPTVNVSITKIFSKAGVGHGAYSQTRSSVPVANKLMNSLMKK